MLQGHGSATAKDPILQRLVRWNESWRSRSAELAALAASPTALDSPLILENSLANALVNARCFTLRPEETARVRALCLTRACRDNVDSLARARAMQAPAPDRP